jgi:hypothetical protein
MSSTVPTVGTNLVTVRFGNQKETTIREVGGAMAPIWRSYCSGIQKIIYVVDASNLCQIAAAAVLLYTILAEPSLHKAKVWNTRVLVITFWGHTETFIDTSKEVRLEVNVEKTKYMLVSHDHNAGQNWDIKIGNKSFENVSQFKYLGTTVTNQNLIQEEIKRRLNSGNACYHSVQNLLSSRLLSKNVNVRIYNTIILPMVLYGCET